jgi:hypothetical protein
VPEERSESTATPTKPRRRPVAERAVARWVRRMRNSPAKIQTGIMAQTTAARPEATRVSPQKRVA